jgi:uridine kinase
MGRTDPAIDMMQPFFIGITGGSCSGKTALARALAHRSEGSRYGFSNSKGKRPIVILEGLHALHREEIRVLEDLRIFIDCSPDTCLARRIERDTRERGRDPESVREQWRITVMPMYRAFVEPARAFTDIIVDGEKPVDESVRQVLLHKLTPFVLGEEQHG